MKMYFSLVVFFALMAAHRFVHVGYIRKCTTRASEIYSVRTRVLHCFTPK